MATQLLPQLTDCLRVGLKTGGECLFSEKGVHVLACEHLLTIVDKERNILAEFKEWSYYILPAKKDS